MPNISNIRLSLQILYVKNVFVYIFVYIVFGKTNNQHRRGMVPFRVTSLTNQSLSTSYQLVSSFNTYQCIIMRYLVMFIRLTGFWLGNSINVYLATRTWREM